MEALPTVAAPSVPRGASLFVWCVSTLVKHFLQLNASPSTSHLATAVAQRVKRLPEDIKRIFLKAFRKLCLLNDSTLSFFALAQLSPDVELRLIHLGEEALFHVAPLWTGIRKLDLSWTRGASDRMVQALCEGPASQTLESLKLTGSNFINDACLEHLQLLPRLRKLSLSECPGITGDCVLILRRVCPQLQFLALHDLDRSKTLAKNLLPSSPLGDNSQTIVPLPNLRALEVDGSSVSASQLRKIFIKSWKERASEIRKVMRIFCPNLKAAYLRSEELPYLLMPLDKCDFESMKQERINRLKNNLEQFEIDPMVAYPKLKFVELKCTNSSPSFGIREFLSRCPNMKGLMISDAPALHDYGLHHFNHLRAMFIFGGKCFRLFPYSLAEHLRPNERVDCFHSLKVLDINGTQIPVSLLPTLGHLHSLHRLSISALKFQLPPDVNSEERIAENMGPILEDLISGLSELRSLLLSNIAWQHPFEFSIFHEKLRRLELAEVQGGFCSSPFKMTVKEIRCPRLRSCKLQLDVMHPAEFAALMEQVRIGSPWLTNVQGAVLQTTLHISNSSQPIPASLHPSVWRAPLAKISLQKCRSLDREGMETLFAALPRLWTFKIEKCKGLGTLNGCTSKSLHSLRIIGGNGLHGEMDFSGFPNLHEVDLQLGGKITSVNLVDLSLLAVITFKRINESATSDHQGCQC